MSHASIPEIMSTSLWSPIRAGTSVNLHVPRESSSEIEATACRMEEAKKRRRVTDPVSAGTYIRAHAWVTWHPARCLSRKMARASGKKIRLPELVATALAFDSTSLEVGEAAMTPPYLAGSPQVPSYSPSEGALYSLRCPICMYPGRIGRPTCKTSLVWRPWILG